ncbi:hypothetical protein [Mycobacterium sp. AZCC_0083]|uniref:hypothetical protein n=1 Tax=Mycobacterium sp. AZCC_0083 TaxID=2735882 RepID=UPI001617D335|nr:hypothetical protein [Mycobacterium sp. AZCC_0083]MBB5167165.1 hypothetical protein [Mycobacterium sp. AZCC_0083]
MKFEIFTEEENRYGRPDWFYRAIDGDTEYLVNYTHFDHRGEIAYWITGNRPLGSGPGNWDFDTSGAYETKEAAMASVGGWP